MAIVRELLVRLGFQTDKRAINQTNQAITGFRTRFAFVAATATYAFSRIASFFNDIAKATLDSDDLAKSLGISLRELTKIQGAARQVGRLDFSQTSEALTKVQTLLTDYQSGTSRVFADIARDAANAGFFLDPKGDAVKNFKILLQYLGSIKDETQRIRIAGNIFGGNLKNRISDLSEEFDKFEKAIPDFEKLGKDVEASKDPILAYKDSINTLTSAWENLTLKLSQTVIPALTLVANVAAGISELFEGLFKFDLDFAKKGLSSASSSLDGFYKSIGLQRFFDFFKNAEIKQVAENVADYVLTPQPYDYEGMRAARSNITLNSEFNISVPAGTPEETVTYVSEEVDRRFKAAAAKMFQEIQSNNPMVE